MKKKINKLIAMLLISCLTLSNMSLNSFAAVGTGGKKLTSRGTGQTSLYQDGSLSAAYSEGEASEKYSAPAPGTYEGDVYKGLKNFQTEIDVFKYKMPLDEAMDSYQKLINANPDLFFVSNMLEYYSIISCKDCGGLVGTIDGKWVLLDDDFYVISECNHSDSHNCERIITSWVPHYIANKSQLSVMTSNFNKAVETAIAGIDDSMSDLEKALYCHDYLVKNNAYDYENYTANKVPAVSHSAYGALVLNTSVCDGYSLAFSYLMKQCGINARLVTSNTMHHAWNAVEIDGSWYFLDLTNDDPVCGFYEKINNQYVLSSAGDNYSLVCHNAFLSSEELWKKTEYSDGCYRDWAQTDIECNNSKYDDAVWKDVENEYGYCDGYWYYMKEELNPDTHNEEKASIMRTEDPTIAGTPYIVLDDFKDTWPSEKGNWFGIFSNVSVYAPKKQLFFNTKDHVWTVDLSSDNPEVQSYLELTGSGIRSIFGLIVLGDNLYVGLTDDPNKKHDLYRQFLGDFKIGDADGNGEINTDDALMVLKIVAGFEGLDYTFEAANTNNNNAIDTDDALQILKFVAGTITEF